jgi:glucokinase
MISLGIDLGGTKILAAVVENGVILDRERVDTPQTGFEDVADTMAECARTLLRRGHEVAAVGIGSPGPLDYAKGEVIFAPNIAGMVNAPIVAAVSSRLGVGVSLENDANAAGYAEHLYGAARGLSSSIFVTISTGIGGGLFLGDKLIRGAHGQAGEIGHMTVLPGGPMGGDGHTGSLEAIAAGRSIARDASYAFGYDMDTEELFELAIKGDRKAIGIVDNAALFTGIGLANLTKIFDPEAFVVGGGVSAVGPFYLDRVQAVCARYLVGYHAPRFVLAKLGNDAGVIGAAAVAAHEVASRQGGGQHDH